MDIEKSSILSQSRIHDYDLLGYIISSNNEDFEFLDLPIEEDGTRKSSQAVKDNGL